MTLTAAKTTNFICSNPGPNSFALAEDARAMPIYSDMTINGSADLSKIVKGKSGAKRPTQT